MTKDFSVRIDADLYAQLAAAANAENRSVSNFVGVLIAAHLAQGTKLAAGTPPPPKGRPPKAKA